MNFHTKHLFLLVFSFSLAAHSQPIEKDYLEPKMRELQLTSALTAFMVSLKTLFSGKGIFSDLPSASAATTKFVKEIAQEHGITDEIDVKIEHGYAAGTGTILLPQDPNSYFLQTTLDTSLHNYNYGLTSDIQALAELELMDHIGSLDHELTHYKNNDMRNSLIFSAGLNFTLISAYLFFEYKVLAPQLRKTHELKKWLYACGSGLGLSTISYLIDSWTRRLREKRADEGVRNDPAVLKAMIAWTAKDQIELKELLNNSSSRFCRLIGAWIEKYPCLYLLFDPVHPPLPERQARFQERLDALKVATR